jgi:hypothetical protein
VIAMGGWRDVHVGAEGDDVAIDGCSLWQHAWRRTPDAPLSLPHPDHRDQRHRFDVYEAGTIDDPVRFAAGELSNGVWGFYVPA